MGGYQYLDQYFIISESKQVVYADRELGIVLDGEWKPDSQTRQREHIEGKCVIIFEDVLGNIIVGRLYLI